MPEYGGGTTRSGATVSVDWADLAKKLPSGKTVDKGIRDILKCDDLFNCKPAMLRAFEAVKDTAPSHTPHSDDYVTRAEFRLLMAALR
eukprot:gene53841-48109_t